MITSLWLVNFKSFVDETLRVGPFGRDPGSQRQWHRATSGPPSGFLHGIGRGYILEAIMGGNHVAGGYMECAGMRGATNEIIRFRHSEFSISVQANAESGVVNYTLEAEDSDYRSGWL